MSEKSPEAIIKDALAMSIRQMFNAQDAVKNAERRLREEKGKEENRRREAERYHAGLVAMRSTTDTDFDTYVANFKRANPS